MRAAPALACAAAAALFAALALLVADRWSPLERLDHQVDADLNDYIAQRTGQAHVWRLISDILAPAVLRGALVVLAVALLFYRHRRAALLCAGGAVGSLVVVTVVKNLVDRPRPTVRVPVAHSAGASFPSGHALTSMTAALVLVALLPDVGSRAVRIAVAVVAGMLAVAVGFSRMILGVHFPSDVVGGWCGGVMLVAGLLALLPRTTAASEVNP